MEGIIVTPGEEIICSSKVEGGKGTYMLNGNIYASLVGRVVVKGSKVEVLSSKAGSEIVPYVDSIITGKVMKVTSKMVDVLIVCVGDKPVHSGFKGVLRKENVRAFEVDQVDLFDNFRMGDIVTAKVAALGGARSYELSTSENHLGVIHAICSVSGQPMVPASWVTMRCPVTGTIEKRKVAKVVVDTQE